MQRRVSLSSPGITALLIATLLTACGGGGGSSSGGDSSQPPVSEAPIQNGNWVDIAIGGLSYVSGNINGTTSGGGGYTYRCPSGCDSIRFSIGGITIGQATAAVALTLRELQGGMEGGVLSNVTLRRGQFLFALDNDADVSNGISIPAEVANVLATRSLNYSSSTFDTDLAAILDLLRSDTRLTASYRAAIATPTTDFVRAMLEQGEAIARGVFVETPTSAGDVNEVRKHVVKLPDSALAPYFGTSTAIGAAFVKGIKPALGGGIAIVPGSINGTNLEFRAVSSRGITVAAPRYFDGADVRDATVIVTAEPNALPSVGQFSLGSTIAELKSLTTLKTSANENFSGRPVPLGASGSDGARNLDESLKPRNPEFDQLGLDPAGLTIAADGTNWICDRRGPFLMQIDAQNRTTLRLGPAGNAGLLPGVTRSLPSILESRQAGLGCGGLAIRATSGEVVMAVGAVLDVGGRTANTASLVRLVTFNPRSNVTRQFALPIAANEISLQVLDLDSLNEDRLLALVRYRPGNVEAAWEWDVRVVDLSGATDLTNRVLTSGPSSGLALEYGTRAAVEASGVKLASMTRVLSLRPLGWRLERPEGLARIDNQTLLIMAEVNGGVTSRIRGGDPALSVEQHQVDRNGLITPRASPSSAAPIYEIVPASADQRQLILWNVKLKTALN
ncbi:MAG: esterase-like activity of phytase family protein [Steroidobacteraceae bacterium]